MTRAPGSASLRRLVQTRMGHRFGWGQETPLKVDEALWQLALEGVGLSPHEDGLWRDAPDAVGAVKCFKALFAEMRKN